MVETTTTTTTPTRAELEAAAAMLNAAELSALTAILGACDAFFGTLSTVVEQLPATEYISNAKRIATELQQQLNYRRVSELPNLIAALDPTDPAGQAAP